MKPFSFLRAVVLAAILFGCAPLLPQQTDLRQSPAAFAGSVGRVVDGDTFTLQGESRRVRVWGLDAPEGNRPGGSNATATMRQMVAGRWLQCNLRDIDRYERIVAQCFLPDGRDIAAEMIRAGVATEYCSFSRGYYGTC
ncbi:thermonuclease family protein [Paracoccus sp. PAR01]|uniref:thermonuclease family protein n=1 Tax=Paracoccus sp. PAR01 TaxID=2769282 RepID=UPI001783C42D|nr:thermonuclease family protein [Paracoccus sp. PAR01]MBD9529123.1 thermonuclease family protein [Paracoccus sp. PAR01]